MLAAYTVYSNLMVFYKMARETLHWDRPFHTVRSGSFENGDIAWFPEGYINASYNCVDRWAFQTPDKVRICFLAICKALDTYIVATDCYHLRGRRAK